MADKGKILPVPDQTLAMFRVGLCHSHPQNAHEVSLGRCSEVWLGCGCDVGRLEAAQQQLGLGLNVQFRGPAAAFPLGHCQPTVTELSEGVAKASLVVDLISYCALFVFTSSPGCLCLVLLDLGFIFLSLPCLPPSVRHFLHHMHLLFVLGFRVLEFNIMQLT